MKPELHSPIWEQGARFRRISPSRQSLSPLHLPVNGEVAAARLRYESFSEWRHAYDRERRKKLAATKLAAASTPTVRWQPSFAPVPSVLTLLSPSPSSQSQLPLSPPQAPPSDSHLTGTLREIVQVTPRGRRRHRLEETSPGGTTRVDEYFSPAGGDSVSGFAADSSVKAEGTIAACLQEDRKKRDDVGRLK